MGFASRRLRRIHPGGGFFIDAGRCPEVQGMLHDLSARRPLRLRALLRAARGRLRSVGRPTPRSSSAASRRGRRRCGATPTSCRCDPSQPPLAPLPTGLTPLVRADRLAERLGLGELWIKNETANPTHSFKDRVVSVALARARELGLRHAGLRVDRQPRQRRGGPLPRPPACPPTSSSPATSRRRRSSPPAPTAPAWSACAATTTPSTASAPSSRRERDGWAFVNVNVRPYYAEGSKTLAYETAEQLGWELPDRVVAPIASGSLFTKVGARLQRVPGRRDSSRATLPGHERRPGRGLLARGPGVGGRDRRLPPGQAGHDRQVAGHRQPGRRALRGRAGPRHRRRDRRGHRRRDPRRHPAAGRDDRHLHRDRGRRDDRGARQARRARRHRPRPSASSPTSPATG